MRRTPDRRRGHFVEPLQGRDRFAKIAQFTVVIVLQNKAVVFICPFEEAVSLADGHDGTRGKLIRGTDVDCRRNVGWQFLNHDAVRDDGNLRNAHTVVTKDVLYWQVTGIFCRHMTDIHLAHDTAKMRGQLLGAGADDDLVGAAMTPRDV